MLTATSKIAAVDGRSGHEVRGEIKAAAHDDEGVQPSAFGAARERSTPQSAEAILRQRAAALARVPAELAGAGETVQLVTFSLADERYALEARYVREVARLHDFTPVPGTPDYLVGITNLRGEILAVIDLRKLLGVADRGLTDRSRIVVLGDQRCEFGLLADAMHDLRTLPADELLDPPEAVSGIGREYLRGITSEALIVLDGAVLLNGARLFVDDNPSGSL